MFSLFADAVNLQYPYHPHQMTNRPIVGANDVYERTISLRIFPTMPDDHDHDDDEHDEHDDCDDEYELEELDLGCMKTVPGSLFQLILSHQIFFSRHVLTPGT